MFTNLLLSVVLLAFTGAPVLDESKVVGSRFGQCPDGSVLEMKIYDADSNDPEAALIEYKRGNKTIAVLDYKEKKIYLYSKKEWKPIDEVAQKYPSPCDIPEGTGL